MEQSIVPGFDSVDIGCISETKRLRILEQKIHDISSQENSLEISCKYLTMATAAYKK